MITSKLLKTYRIDRPGKFKLSDHDPADHGGLDIEKMEARDLLADGVQQLAEMQEKLYAQDRWAVLVILQAMDAAGKDSVVEHVMSGINPQGCEVHPFKQPSPEELDHDFMWRTTKVLPPRGHIGLFNRSYYEEVLVARVHPAVLAKQKLPPQLVTKKIWKERFKAICDFEEMLAQNGTVVLKFFLNVSKAEQKRRFLDRIDDPAKHWKFNEGDVAERKYWKDYMAAYEDMIRHTSCGHAPWFVVPADNKWYTRLVVAAAITQAMEKLDLSFPTLEPEAQAGLARARRELMAERG